MPETNPKIPDWLEFPQGLIAFEFAPIHKKQREPLVESRLEKAFVGWAVPTGLVQMVGTAHPTTFKLPDDLIAFRTLHQHKCKPRPGSSTKLDAPLNARGASFGHRF
jgi:hypothetical protein